MRVFFSTFFFYSHQLPHLINSNGADVLGFGTNEVSFDLIVAAAKRSVLVLNACVRNMKTKYINLSMHV